MRHPTRPFLIALALIVTVGAHAQRQKGLSTKRIIVKTNVLNLVFQKPTISVEKAFSSNFSAEVSYVQGRLDDFLFTDHYDFEGVLLRVKKYVTGIRYREANPYAAVYAGNLYRNIEAIGHVDNAGFFSTPSRDFHANSIRGGGSLGVLYITKNNLVIDGQMSLGYGRYINPKKLNPYDNAKGYVDLQLGLSIGYCF